KGRRRHSTAVSASTRPRSSLRFAMAASCRTCSDDLPKGNEAIGANVPASLTSALIKEQAQAFGFDLCGIARAERHPKLGRLAEWIARGFSGDMQYLADSLDERLDPQRVLPTVRSVVSLGCVYNVACPAAEPTTPGDA